MGGMNVVDLVSCDFVEILDFLRNRKVIMVLIIDRFIFISINL